MTDLPPDPLAAMRATAASIGFVVPDACVPGVLANIELLAGHAAGLEEFALPDDPSA